MNIPKIIYAGDSLTWDDNPTSDNLGNAIDSSSWTLKYDFRQSGVTNLSKTAVTQGSGWRTSLTSAETGAYAAGKLYWQAYATSGSSRVTLGSGSIDIKINLVAATNSAEFRSQAKQDLAAVQAAIRAMISGGAVAEYTIGNRSLRKLAMEDLIMLESKLKAEVVREEKAEKIANGEGNPNNLFVRFK